MPHQGSSVEVVHQALLVSSVTIEIVTGINMWIAGFSPAGFPGAPGGGPRKFLRYPVSGSADLYQLDSLLHQVSNHHPEAVASLHQVLAADDRSTVHEVEQDRAVPRQLQPLRNTTISKHRPSAVALRHGRRNILRGLAGSSGVRAWEAQKHRFMELGTKGCSRRPGSQDGCSSKRNVIHSPYSTKAYDS